MSGLFGNLAGTLPTVPGSEVPQLADLYRPVSVDSFAGLEKPKAICRKLIESPRNSYWCFVGPSGTGKTSLV